MVYAFCYFQIKSIWFKLDNFLTSKCCENFLNRKM